MPGHVARQAQNGELTFYSKFMNVLSEADFEIRFCSDDPDERRRAVARPGYSVSLMQKPINARGVTIRKNYFYPFWNIEQSAERWNWPVAKASFDPSTVAQNEAAIFANYWRKLLFGSRNPPTRRDGYVYAPLQGLLTKQRSFQSCSPIEMLEMIASFEPSRDIIATLHPRETYSDRELNALSQLVEQHPRLSLSTAPMADLLSGCDYVATQNSSVAVFGYFLSKPAALFGKIDFHHIAANVDELGAEQALKTVPELRPDFDAYLCWFFKHRSINAELPNAEDRIADALRRVGWAL